MPRSADPSAADAILHGWGAVFEDEVLDRLRARNPRYHDAAYGFILAALHYVLARLTEPRHISGRELAEGARELAMERYGLMARTVLEYWGIRTTADFGELVFGLVECGVLIKQEGDTQAEFEDVYDFEEAFDRGYSWGRGGGRA